MPAALAIAEPVQWLAEGGGPASVNATTRSANAGRSGGNARRARLIPPQSRGSFGAEAILPAPDDSLGLSSCTHDLGRAVTIGGQQDDLGPPDVLLAAIAAATAASSARR